MWEGEMTEHKHTKECEETWVKLFEAYKKYDEAGAKNYDVARAKFLEAREKCGCWK